jgi:Caspase domain
MSRKALVVGMSNYRGEKELRACVNDANEVSNLLKKNWDNTGNFQVLKKLNPDSTEELLVALNDLFKDPNEVALFYFSGHGILNAMGTANIATLDATHDLSGIPMSYILGLANKSPALNRIIILDCCFSGSIAEPQKFYQSEPLCQGVTVLTACSEFEAAIALNEFSTFTSLMIEALKGGAADLNGEITPGSIYSFIDQAMGTWDQRPMFKTNVTGFISLRQVEPPISFDVLMNLIVHFEYPTSEIPLDKRHEHTAPEADPDLTTKFQELQKLARVGLVIPIGEKHMYWAAMNNKSCKLTPLGRHYWRLAKEDKL